MTLMGAIKQLHELRSAEDMPFYYKPAIAEVINVLLMDAQEVRHGHWIERTKVHPDLLNDSTYNYECSECGYWDQHGANVEVPYCWHCGCKMDEVTE